MSFYIDKFIICLFILLSSPPPFKYTSKIEMHITTLKYQCLFLLSYFRKGAQKAFSVKKGIFIGHWLLQKNLWITSTRNKKELLLILGILLQYFGYSKWITEKGNHFFCIKAITIVLIKHSLLGFDVIILSILICPVFLDVTSSGKKQKSSYFVFSLKTYSSFKKQQENIWSIYLKRTLKHFCEQSKQIWQISC